MIIIIIIITIKPLIAKGIKNQYEIRTDLEKYGNNKEHKTRSN